MQKWAVFLRSVLIVIAVRCRCRCCCRLYFLSQNRIFPYVWLIDGLAEWLCVWLVNDVSPSSSMNLLVATKYWVEWIYIYSNLFKFIIDWLDWQWSQYRMNEFHKKRNSLLNNSLKFIYYFLFLLYYRYTSFIQLNSISYHQTCDNDMQEWIIEISYSQNHSSSASIASKRRDVADAFNRGQVLEWIKKSLEILCWPWFHLNENGNVGGNFKFWNLWRKRSKS